MYRQDWLLEQIRRVVEAVARLKRGEVVSQGELDAAFRDLCGLDLRTIDALPPEALASLLEGGDPRGRERLAALADLLEATGRVDKARALRGL